MDGCEAPKLTLDAAHVRDPQSPQVERGPRVFGNNVDPRTAFNQIRIDANAPAKVVPFFHTRNLRRQFVYRVHALLGGQTCVRSSTADDEFRLADTFPRSL